MAILSREQRTQLSKVVLDAREIAEAAAKKALHSLGVDEADAPSHLSPENRALRRALRAQARQLGDKEDPRKKGSYDLYHLTEKIAYDQWHRMLFARFLAESDLLIAPEHGVPVSLQECRELAPELNLRDEWDVAVRFAAKSLPQIFRPDDPAGKIELAPEDRASLRGLVVGLTRDTFLASDSLGWSYQFWQTERKERVNEAGNKIGADELPAVTQLFTEDYMVDFLLDNTLGAWHAGNILAANATLAENAQSEDDFRQGVSLPGCPWKYLRFIKGNDSKWTPAAGIFDGWPKMAKELKCLDPCMGSGHFVVAMFERLVALRMAEEKLGEKEAVAAVIRDNLLGLEIDPRCTQIAAFNLALAAWRRVGHCALPAMNLACSGLAPNAKLEDWLKIAGDNQKLQRGMERLYRLFQKAPVLGSLINPRAHEGDLLVAAFHELQPLLEKALAQETEDDVHEMAVTARGLAMAAETLADQFTLIATNVPYLGRGKQDETLKSYCQLHHLTAKADLSACFVDRCFDYCRPAGTIALVTPVNWWYIQTYRDFRKNISQRRRVNLLINLGPAAFDDMNWWAAQTGLSVISDERPADYVGADASFGKGAQRKRLNTREVDLARVPISSIRKETDYRFTINEVRAVDLLSDYADVYVGLQNGDSPRFIACFWEINFNDGCWDPFQLTNIKPGHFGGREGAIFWERGEGQLARSEGFYLKGREAWGRKGIIVRQMNVIPSFYVGEKYDQSSSVIVPKDVKNLLPIFSFIASDEYKRQLKKIDPNFKITNSTMTKVSFDLHEWTAKSILEFPNGLPTPNADDPTQWLFSGQPKGSDQPLQVAVARLMGYQWPRQTGSSFPDCPALGPDGLEQLADEDGIVCINPIKGEQPAAEKLRALLAAAFGTEWTPGKQNELLGQMGFGGKTLEDWLRNGFFEQHCQLFHQRPFVWHIWDGRRDGFSALVNYHKLNRSNLEKLTYTFLGDWIGRQKAANDAGEEGSDARLQAAEELKGKLEKIIEGEKPFDIFVRWKPIEKQPVGWERDLNDGVRLNIRPFVEAGVLRKDPKVNWKKDRGKDVASAPWYKVFKGERINDHHLTLAEKRKARGLT